MITGRELTRDEIDAVWTIDRSEVIDRVYRVEQGALVLEDQRHHLHGWPEGEAEKATPGLHSCFERGGWFYGMFEGEALVGVVILDSARLGSTRDQLQLKFLYVDCAHRATGMGKRLFTLARDTARERGAKRLYISATPSENTIDFYRRRGCTLIAEPDAHLFALEPEDIHLECDV